MPLKSTINNTNTQKENIKTVANNIDNKLVELGGEQATDLSDVPNKIQKLIKQYNKVVIGSKKCKQRSDIDPFSTIINVNADFVIKRVIGIISRDSTDFFTQQNACYYMGVDSSLHYSKNNARYNEKFGRVYIDNLSNNFTINYEYSEYSNEQFIYYIALG